MRACDHPDYEAERQHLTGVLRAVDGRHEAVVVTGASGGADGPATVLVRGRTTEQLGLRRASASPYFARVADEEDSFYIGYERIRKQSLTGPLLVIGWTAPMAKRFYEPDADVTGRRRYAIEARQLHDIADLAAPPQVTSDATSSPEPSGDPYLRTYSPGG
jgi:hypothetical protein